MILPYQFLDARIRPAQLCLLAACDCLQRLRSDDAIHQLAEEEFFLSEATVLNILRKMQRLGEAELKRNAQLKKPQKLPTITADMLSLMPERLPKK